MYVRVYVYTGTLYVHAQYNIMCVIAYRSDIISKVYEVVQLRSVATTDEALELPRVDQ